MLPLVMLTLSAPIAQAQTLSPTTATFGNWVVQTTSAAKVISLSNTQTVPLTISSISVSGDFAETSTCPIAPKTLGAGASCKVAVTFTPTALGAQAGTLTVNDSASNSPQTAQVSGTGVLPVILSSNSLPFGNQFVNTTSTAKSVTLVNYQTVPLTISGISASGNFAQTSTCPVSPNTLAARSSCAISVTFTPQATGALTGTLSVSDNASNSPQTAQLSGTGVAPVRLSTSSLPFASQVVGTTSAAKNINLTNEQKVALTIGSIATSGDFAQTSNCPLTPNTLAALSSCTISVTFTPTTPGNRTGTLTVSDNASTSPQTASLSGTGSLTGLVSITVTPVNPTVSPGGQQQLLATGMWQNGYTLNVSNFVTWLSSAQSVATVNSGGLVQAVGNGTTTITAAYESVTGSTMVTVAPPALTSITVIPATPSVAAGGYEQFTAILNYSDGSTKDVTSSVTWSSSATTVATVTSSGLASGLALGSTQITGTLGGITGSTTLAVSQPQCVAPPPGLVGWWTGDGNTVDIAGDNSGVLQNGVTYGTGEVAQAFSFAGNGSSVLVNSPVYSPTAGTLMFWFMPTGSGALTGSFDGVNRTPGLSVDSNGNLDWEFGNLSVQGVGQVSLNQWYFVAMTYASSGSEVTVNVYLNGNLAASAIASPNSSWYQQVAFGAYLGTPTPSFSGSMDEISIFSQALSAQQIQQIYTVFSAGMCKPTLQSIAVNPTNSTIAPGLLLQFSAAGTYSDSTTHDLTTSATWTSSSPSAATVNAAGLATAVAPGSTTVVASLGNQNGSTTLNVGPSLVSIQVSPLAPTIAAGTEQAFTATGIYSDESTGNLTTSASWSSSNSTVATISSGGLATGVVAGQSTITATFGSITGSAALGVTSATLSFITVTPANPSIAAGVTQQFSAIGTFSDSSTQDLTTQVTWSSSSPSVATINTNGLATTLVTGQTTITATFGLVNSSVGLTVNAAVLTSISVQPANPFVVIGSAQPFTATGTFSDGSTQDLTSVSSWGSSNQTVASINQTGLAMSLAVGATTISATFNSINGSTALTVTAVPPQLQSIAVTPATATIPAGTTQAFTALGTFSDGSSQNLTSSVVWSSSVLTVATVSNTSGTNGLATGAGSGGTVITATSGSVSGSADLTVTNAILAAIEISPEGPTIPIGNTEQFTATGLYTDGSSGNITTNVTWASSSPTVATASNTSGSQGLAASTGTGFTTISASLGSVASSTTLTVQDELVSISVTPSTASIVLGTDQQFAATGTYLSGIMENLTNSVLWSSSSTGVATITSGGLAVSESIGQTILTASSGSIIASATLMITPLQQAFSVLYTFTGGQDGANPQAGLVADPSGTFYGTTSGGGDFGLGAIFVLSPVSGVGWAETVLHSFAGGTTDGASPRTPLLQLLGGGDDNGNLYGMTFAGGASGDGVVFKLEPTGREVAVHSFSGGADGGQPYYGGLIHDSVSNLYGATHLGGDLSCVNPDGCGVVFMLNKYHVVTVLHSFTYNPPTSQDGAYPYGGLVWDSVGNLYGTTFGGGTGGVGAVFKLDSSFNETVLYSFSNATPDGINPDAGLIVDNAGNLYGTTSATNTFAGGFGAVFKLTASGNESLLHIFTGYPADGAGPIAGLLRDSSGNLYGTTLSGGSYNCGTIFKLDSKNHETVLYSFTGGADGSSPMGPLVHDAAGNLYGTTNQGGSGFGVVFKIIP
jgi:uncharacterized repeat protein (TIGR03803 family)